MNFIKKFYNYGINVKNEEGVIMADDVDQFAPSEEELAKRQAKRNKFNALDKGMGYALTPEELKELDPEIKDYFRTRYIERRVGEKMLTLDRKERSKAAIKELEDQRNAKLNNGYFKGIKHWWRKKVKGQKLDSEISLEKINNKKRAFEKDSQGARASDQEGKMNSIGNLVSAAKIFAKYGVKKDEFENYCYEHFSLDKSKPIKGQFAKTLTGPKRMNSIEDFYDAENIMRYIAKVKNPGMDIDEVGGELQKVKDLFIKDKEAKLDYKSIKG